MLVYTLIFLRSSQNTQVTMTAKSQLLLTTYHDSLQQAQRWIIHGPQMCHHTGGISAEIAAHLHLVVPALDGATAIPHTSNLTLALAQKSAYEAVQNNYGEYNEYAKNLQRLFLFL